MTQFGKSPEKRRATITRPGGGMPTSAGWAQKRRATEVARLETNRSEAT
jgi:hypothetical protein